MVGTTESVATSAMNDALHSARTLRSKSRHREYGELLGQGQMSVRGLRHEKSRIVM